MRICFASRRTAGSRSNGIGAYIAEAAQALSVRGHEVWLITDDPDRPPETPPGVYRTVPLGHGLGPEQRARLAESADPQSYSLLLHQTLEATGVHFDYIEFPDTGAPGLVATREQRTFGAYGTTILGVMLHEPTRERAGPGMLQRRSDLAEITRLEEQTIRQAPMINSVSFGLRDSTMGRLGIRRDIAVIRYPMGFDAVVPPGPPPRGSLPAVSFLYFGSLDNDDEMAVLFEAFRALPELRLTLIGDRTIDDVIGPKPIASLWRSAPLNVQFEPEPPHAWLQNRVRDSDVCLFPSQRKSWSTSCAEAMAASRVVIVHARSAMAEVVEHGRSGFLFDGPAGLVRVIREELHQRLARLDAIGTAAGRRIRKITNRDAYCDALERRVRRFLRLI